MPGPSRLNLWLKCPLAWKIKYIDGIERLAYVGANVTCEKRIKEADTARLLD